MASLNLRARFGAFVSAHEIPFPGNGDFGSKRRSSNPQPAAARKCATGNPILGAFVSAHEIPFPGNGDFGSKRRSSNPQLPIILWCSDSLIDALTGKRRSRDHHHTNEEFAFKDLTDEHTY